DLAGRVLLLGTDVDTSLHHAEVRAGQRPTVPFSGPDLVGGERHWLTFDEAVYHEQAFPPVKAAFEATGAVSVGVVGSASA
ncbi:AAC(3) family N-acetyltransferase, partial [Deinococcus sp. GbtcB9]|uniref:AAC(3) family N-acetyltransferase n=1 Tax=Deinococcus sp. GbtcB9 TaxID=2824754 RepID=UPI001C2F3C89